MKIRRLNLFALTLLLIAGTHRLMAEAQDPEAAPPAPLASEPWRFSLAFPMIWTPTIHGRIIGGGDRVDFTVPFSDIVEDLSFGMMADFYATKGPWSFVVKTNYLHSEGEGSTSGLNSPIWGVPLVASHKITTSLKMSVNDFLARHEVTEWLKLYTGARYLYTKVDMDITSTTPALVVTNTSQNLAHENLVDWVLGLQFEHDISSRWGVRISGDIILAGDNDRDQSAEGTLVYKFNKRHSAWAGYRYLSIGSDSTSNGNTYEIDFTEKGPMLGWTFTW